MPNAFDVTNFFLAKSQDDEAEISNLKLQKLLYYAKGFHFAIFEEPLFPEKIYAWTHGPVIPEVYHEYKNFKGNPITDLPADYGAKNSLSKEQIDLLDEVWSVFGQFSAWKLRDMSHNESPWINHEKDASEISDQDLIEYFKTRIK